MYFVPVGVVTINFPFRNGISILANALLPCSAWFRESLFFGYDNINTDTAQKRLVGFGFCHQSNLAILQFLKLHLDKLVVQFSRNVRRFDLEQRPFRKIFKLNETPDKFYVRNRLIDLSGTFW